METPKIFQAEHLEFFDLTPETFSHSSLRKKYLSYVLKHHPDKNDGARNYNFEEGQAVYSALLAGFETFAVWQKDNPNLTLHDTIEWIEPPEGAAYARDLAPTWDPRFMSKIDVVDDLERALEEIGLEFQFSLSDMAASLRQAAVGTSFTFLLRGAEQPAEPRYHGTSWKGFIGISQRGFLPCWGAGRAMALRNFRVDLHCSSD